MPDKDYLIQDAEFFSQKHELIAFFRSTKNSNKVIVLRYWGEYNTIFAVHDYYIDTNTYENGIVHMFLYPSYLEFDKRSKKEFI